MGEVNEKKQEAPENVGVTLDKLKNYCNQLLSQRNQIAQQLQEVTNVLNKLPWLFRVLELKENFHSNFVTYCAEEIEYIMTPPEESKDKKDKETEKTEETEEITEEPGE